jgi:single-stranded DNA-binding protein
MPYPTINRVVLVGRLTRDPELRMLPSGETVCVLRVACNSKRRGDGGSYEEKPNYFDIDVFGAPGQHVAGHAHKGERVAVDGQLESREWKNSFQERREAVPSWPTLCGAYPAGRGAGRQGSSSLSARARTRRISSSEENRVSAA